MLSKILTGSLLAGFFAGLASAVLQLTFIKPVFLHAELLKSGAASHFENGTTSAIVETHEINFVRDGLSVLFWALVYVGYAIILTCCMAIAEIRHIRVNMRSGVLWGLAGFTAFHLAPAFSLPPELPRSAAAYLLSRQMWWWFAVVATGVGTALLAFGEKW